MLQKFFVVHPRLAYFYKFGTVGVNVGQHVNFQPAFLPADALKFATYALQNLRKKPYRGRIEGKKLSETDAGFSAVRQKRRKKRKQVVLFYEISNLKQQMDKICYAAIKLLANEKDGLDMPQYRLWLERFNTPDALYSLIDNYLDFG